MMPQEYLPLGSHKRVIHRKGGVRGGRKVDRYRGTSFDTGHTSHPPHPKGVACGATRKGGAVCILCEQAETIIPSDEQGEGGGGCRCEAFAYDGRTHTHTSVKGQKEGGGGGEVMGEDDNATKA